MTAREFPRGVADRVQLHLGCGKRYIPGFVHVDLDNFPHIAHRADIDRLPMFRDETVDLIYCCHAFQYFDRVEAPAVLREWRRVLKPGGILRVSVPDFAALADLYARTASIDLMLGPLFGRTTIQVKGSAFVHYHRTAYDRSSLERVLLEAEFRAVAPYDWRETIHKDFDDFSQAYYPHMDKERGLLISLNVEARK